eukprot:1585033-Ditylum_brightwellii.AAC.1
MGTGQGSTDGPPGWVRISDIILKVYHHMCKRCKFKDPAQITPVQCNADMFVDDATLLHNNKFDTLALQLIQQIQHDAEIWGRMLWVSGGLLELLKSSYFLLIWAFDKSGKLWIVPEEDLPPNK